MDRLKWWRKVTAVSNPTAAAIVSIGASYSDAVDRMLPRSDANASWA